MIKFIINGKEYYEDEIASSIMQRDMLLKYARGLCALCRYNGSQGVCDICYYNENSSTNIKVDNWVALGGEGLED